jgi:hypothetical protein
VSRHFHQIRVQTRKNCIFRCHRIQPPGQRRIWYNLNRTQMMFNGIERIKNAASLAETFVSTKTGTPSKLRRRQLFHQELSFVVLPETTKMIECLSYANYSVQYCDLRICCLIVACWQSLFYGGISREAYVRQVPGF